MAALHRSTRSISSPTEAATGTDRVAVAAKRLTPGPDLVVNLQGDEPLIEPEAIEALLSAMQSSGAEMGTLARPLEDGELERTQVVKVVTDLQGNALYFSRAPIPHRRAGGTSPLARAHVGIYAFTTPCLHRFAALPATPLEQEESLVLDGDRRQSSMLDYKFRPYLGRNFYFDFAQG